MERRESKAIILHPRLAKPEPEAQPGPPARPRNVGDVPDGVLRLVAAKVDCARSLAAFAATCQRFRAVVEDAMWEELCLRDFPTPRGEGQAAPESWEALYRFNQRWLREVLLSGTLQETLDAAYPKWPAGSVISMPAS